MDDFLKGQLRNSLPLEKNMIGIYFLFNKRELVYIGQTTRGHSRIFQHADKEFDSYSFQPYLEWKLNEIEKELILKYKPLYNRVFLESFIGVSKEESKKVEEKKLILKNAMKRSGYSQSDIARKIGKKPTTLHSMLSRAKTLETFERLEKEIREVI